MIPDVALGYFLEMTLLTQLFDGVTPLSIDQKILTTAAENARDGYPGNTRGIAILNNDGVLYRVIGCQSPYEASDVVDALIKLGLTDRVGFDRENAVEIDTLTGKPIDTLWSAVLQVGSVAHPLPVLPRLSLETL